MNNCVLCQEIAKKICYCSGVALCENHFNAHLEALTDIDHYSEDISQANKDLERLKKLKSEIVNFISFEIQRLNRESNDCINDLGKSIDFIYNSLNECKNSIQIQTKQIIAQLNELIENIDQFDLENLGQKLQSKEKELFSIEWDNPCLEIQEKLTKNQAFSIDWYGPSLNYCIYNLKKNNARAYDIRTNKVSVSSINNFDCKVAAHILPIDEGLFITGGANYLGLTTDDAWFVNLKTLNAEQKAKMRYKRYYHSAVYYNNSVYVVGGINERGEAEVPIEVEKYDLKANTWENIGPLTCKRRSPGACVYKNFLFVAGSSRTVDKVDLDTTYIQATGIREKLSEGCTLVSTQVGILVFSPQKILLIDENCEILQDLRFAEQTSWWVQCSPVKYGDLIYLVRFGNYHLVKFNLSKFSFDEESEEIPFDPIK